MRSPLNVLFVESFYGGSHAAFADGLTNHSYHRIDLVALPAQNWRWRTRLAAFEFKELIPNPARYDLVLVTDLIDLSDLRAIWGRQCPPVLLYVHESQLTYPHPKDRNPDMNSALQDIKNCLVADRVLFNSEFHRSGFMREIEALQRRIPAERPLQWRDAVDRKSSVLYPPVDSDKALRRPSQPEAARTVPRVVWNHRWEYDKRPQEFFRCLTRLAAESVPFEVVVLGENPQVRPIEFLRAREKLGNRIVRWGYEESREQYWRWLSASDIVVSTAIQENFGVAIVEAISAGCTPLLPRRLSYPEVIPESFHPQVLYDNEKELTDRLRLLLTAETVQTIRIEGLAQAMERYSWRNLGAEYDRVIEAVAAPRC